MSKRREHFAAIAAYIDGIKTDGACMDCGEQFWPWQMDFDHRPDEVKVYEINDLRSRRRVSRYILDTEISKCDLVCKNCHADRTHRRRNGD